MRHTYTKKWFVAYLKFKLLGLPVFYQAPLFLLNKKCHLFCILTWHISSSQHLCYVLTTVHISQTRKLRPLETDNVSEVTTPESVNSKVSIQTGLSDTTAHVLFSGLLLFSLEAVSDSLRAQGLQHARLPCPLSFPGVCSTSCPLSPRSYLTISSSAYPFSFWTSFSGLSII